MTRDMDRVSETSIAEVGARNDFSSRDGLQHSRFEGDGRGHRDHALRGGFVHALLGVRTEDHRQGRG